MKMFLKNKKIFSVVALIAILVVVFGAGQYALANAPVNGGAAQASLTAPPWWSDGAKYVVAGFGALGVVIMSLMALFAAMIGWIFDYAIELNMDFGANRTVIDLGWKIARDIANMFFILVLLMIAIMTILRISSYQAKSMFTKFIMVAALINFSLTFGLVLVDFTNVLGKTFYDAMKPGGQTISTTIINSSKLQSIWNFNGASAQTSQNSEDGFIKKFFTGQYSPIPKAYNRISEFVGLATLSFEKAVDFAKIAWGNAILLAIMMFVMLVSTAFLLIRVAMLAILLVLSPIAFISVILPKADGIWQKWWSSFFMHAFYFPAFLFLMYFSVAFVSRISSATPTSDFLSSPGLLMGYFIAIIMMIASLVIAQKMGVEGAGAVMKIATTGRQWVTGYVGMQTIGRVGQRLQQNEVVQRTSIGRNMTNKMVGVGAKTPFGSIKQRGDEKAEWLAKQAAGKDSADWIKGMKALGGTGREKFIQSIPDQARGKFLADLKKTDPAAYESTMNTLKVRLGAKALKDFEKAEVQQDMKGVRGDNLGKHLEDIEESIKKRGGSDSDVDAELVKYFKAMDNTQRGNLLEAWHSKPDKLKKIMDWKERELDFDEQDKFAQSVLRRASNPAISNYMKELVASNKIVEEDLILKSLSAQQKVYLWEEALQGGADAARKFEGKIDKLSAEDISGFNRAASSHIQSKKVPDITNDWENLSDELRQNIISSLKPAKITAMLQLAPDKVKTIIRKDMRISGVQDKVDKTAGKRVMNALTPEGESGMKILNEIRNEEEKNNKA